MFASTGDQLEDRERDALDECEWFIRYLRAKATWSKRLTYAATLTIMVSSAAIPVFLLISTRTGGFAFGKLLPALAAGIAALAAGAAQLARPHDRWRTFRRHQHLLEVERLAYLHRAGDYASGDRDQVLVTRVMASRKAVLEDWLQLLPDTSSALANLHDQGRRS